MLRAFLIIFANLLMLAGIFFGYSFVFNESIGVALGTITTVTDAFVYLRDSFISLLSQDPGFLFGLLFCFIVVVFDFKIMGSWWMSFSFSKEKKCNSCSQKLFREQRNFMDRLYSIMIPSRRYRCVGCGKEYLISEKNSAKYPSRFRERAVQTVQSE